MNDKKEIVSLKNEIKKQQDSINDLNNQIHELKVINSRNKEYFLYLEFENEKKDQEIKRLKKENKLLLNSSSWKITKPLRSAKKIIKK